MVFFLTFKQKNHLDIFNEIRSSRKFFSPTVYQLSIVENLKELLNLKDELRIYLLQKEQHSKFDDLVCDGKKLSTKQNLQNNTYCTCTFNVEGLF